MLVRHLTPLILMTLAAGCKQPPPEPEPAAARDTGSAPDTAPAPEPPPPETEPAQDEPAPADSAAGDAAAAAQEEVPEKGIPRFKLAEAGEEAGPIDFRHRKHQKQFACKKCHHEIVKDQKPAGCDTCHGVDEKICDVRTGYHKTCSPCHNAMGMGPVKCAECHKWVKKKKAEEK